MLIRIALARKLLVILKQKHATRETNSHMQLDTKDNRSPGATEQNR
jgi:hypothetical protein